jgi:hypothetical protein
LEKLKQEKTSSALLKDIDDSIDFLKKIEQHIFVNFIGD